MIARDIGGRGSVLRRFFAQQVRWSRLIDRALFPELSVDGNSRFVVLALNLVNDDTRLVEVGGGKSPLFSPEEVKARNLRVTVVDIDEQEIASAPPGSYSIEFVGGIEEVKGNSDNDLVIAQSVLEHVRDGRLAALGIASFVRPGGTVATFCPSRRAWFARLNLLLPEKVKRKILFYIFPGKAERQGFPAFYDGCTPEELEKNMSAGGIEKQQLIPFFVSSYFMFFVPLYLIWRLCTFPFMKLWPERYCETFIFIGRRI